MDEGPQIRCTAFEGHRRIASGSLVEIALALKALPERPAGGPLLVFDDATGKVLDLDLRGTSDEVRDRLADHPVVVSSAEAAAQEHAPHRGPGRDRVRGAQDAAFRFMSATGGDLPGFEEAIRALFAGDRERFTAETRAWPADLRDHGTRLAADAFLALNFVDKLARTPR